MDFILKPSPDMSGVPFVFTADEIQEFFDEKGRFQLKKLRQRQAEKAMQVVLFGYHSLMTKRPEEVHEHARLKHFSLVKARHVRRGYYLMTVEYVRGGKMWRHIFRFVRHTNGGLSGTLYFNSRRRITAR